MERLSGSDDDVLWDSGEDVIEVEIPRPRPSHASNTTSRSGVPPSRVIPPEHLPGLAELLGPSVSESAPTSHLNSRRRHRHHHHHHHHHHRRSRLSSMRRQPARQTSPAVIDLTEEPESPDEVQALPPREQSQPQSQGGRNPRRTNSQHVSPPTLERSDGTLSRSNMPDFIDLTADSPEDDSRPQITSTRVRQPDLRITEDNTFHRLQNHANDSLIHVGFYQHASRFTDIRGFGRRIAGLLNTDLMTLGFTNPPQLDVTRAAHPDSGSSSPKPQMEPTPPTRQGFTRDTCAEPEEERIIICPCCNEELAYDPLSGPAPSNSKSKKRKREHHFWALKKCGHVYCADCFENRKPTKTNRGAGFPTTSTAQEIRCAVEGCETKVVAKGEWVGLYA